LSGTRWRWLRNGPTTATLISAREEFQRFKTHPAIRPTFEGGRRIAYGARALSEGGFQSLPRLTFPGGMLVGDGAGFLNVPKIKGTHTAMKSGMTAAEAVFGHLQAGGGARWSVERLRHTAWDELGVQYSPGLGPVRRHRLCGARHLCCAARRPDLHHHADHTQLKKASECAPIAYPKPDGKVSFDRLSSVFISNTNHEEDQRSTSRSGMRRFRSR
jgi:electron-transferring-flavoprotein dehydrogenase